MPLATTALTVTLTGGLATVRTTRTFRNAEAVPIKAVLTLPVGFEAVVSGLWVEVEARQLHARAQAEQQARQTYEDAVDVGKLAALHEEVLRGVHMISVAQLAPGKEVIVTLEAISPATVLPATVLAGHPFLRIPMTVGQLYGASPLMGADALVTANGPRQQVAVTLNAGTGSAILTDGPKVTSGQEVLVDLSAAIELRFPEAGFGTVTGHSADGRAVSIHLQPLQASGALDLAVLVDRSGSMSAATRTGRSVWSACRDGLAQAIAELTPADHRVLWQFDNTCDFLGAASGPEAARLLDKLGEPQGSTALGQAIHKMIEHGARDILVLTDGQTWAHDVPNMIGSGCRISAVLVGEGSLDANIGHIVAATGGQIFYAPTDDVETALVSAFDAGRGGIGFSLEWSPAGSAGVDTVGRIAAALALPSLPEGLAMDWAFRHGLCSHLASLVVVDDAGEATRLIPETRKVPLSAPSMFDAPMRRMRVAQVADNSAPPRRSVLSDFGDAALRMPKAVFHRPLGEDMRRLAEEIDLETQANTFLSGNFAALSSEDRRLLGRICRCVAVIDLAAELGVPTESLGLALIAEQLPTRSPKVDRFIRRVLGREDPWRLQDLLRKLAIW